MPQICVLLKISLSPMMSWKRARSLSAAAARSAARVIGECLLSTQSRSSTGENEKCYRFEHLTESFSTECPSLSMMLAVIGQIEVMRCFTARTWALRKAGRG